jgi:CheY-like chemotaxis protein
MDGLTAIKAIRRNEEERNAPSVALLAVTADNQLSTNEAIMAAGASGILEKPFNIDALKIMLEEKTTSVA